MRTKFIINIAHMYPETNPSQSPVSFRVPQNITAPIMSQARKKNPKRQPNTKLKINQHLNKAYPQQLNINSKKNTIRIPSLQKASTRSHVLRVNEKPGTCYFKHSEEF